MRSRDLAAMVAAGSFRADLYYRLNALPIRLPTLRDRSDDIEALVEALIDDIARRSGLPGKSVSADALEWLGSQPWPGNIRELRNVLEQVSLMTDDLVLHERHFAGASPGDAAAAPAQHTGAEPKASPPRPLPERVAALERESIAAALDATGGNRVAAAKLLKIARDVVREAGAVPRAVRER